MANFLNDKTIPFILNFALIHPEPPCSFILNFVLIHPEPPLLIHPKLCSHSS